MELEAFTDLIAAVTAGISGSELDGALEKQLNETLPSTGPQYQRILSACEAAIAAGWMCSREAGRIKFGRVVTASARTHGFSVDVVDMADVVGPHHSHPNGEIDLVMPLSSGAKFDGRGAGWRVYGPGSSHSPTVTEGRALVLYLLPAGGIEFSKR